MGISDITDKVGDAINTGGTVVDQVTDVIPVVGSVIGDLGAGGVKLVGGGVKTAGKLAEGNVKQAAVEAAAGVTKAGVTAIPLVEKAELVGISVEDMAEGKVRKLMGDAGINSSDVSSDVSHADCPSAGGASPSGKGCRTV